MSQYLRNQQTANAINQGMVVNNAGGFVFQITPWQRLERFLIIGSDSSVYYVNERKLTFENATNLIACIEEDGLRVVDLIVTISVSGRAPKNDPALFALAACTVYGDKETKQRAYAVLPQVARIGTHLFHFVAYQNTLGAKWNRSRRTAIANWYLSKNSEQLAYQAAKYQGRDGWTNKDLLILSHAKPNSQIQNDIFSWIMFGGEKLGINAEPVSNKNATSILWAMEQAKTAIGGERVNLILDYGLTHEMIPTTWKRDREIWEALLIGMPPEATMRNLGNMSALNIFDTQNNIDLIAKKFSESAITKARLHPISMLTALRTYTSGGGYLSNKTWQISSDVTLLLNSAFYHGFKNCVSTGKPILIALDVSGSMSARFDNSPLTSAEAAAAVAMQVARTEKNWQLVAFNHGIQVLDINPDMTLEKVLKVTSINNMGGTDASLPFIWARNNGYNYSNFVVITDNETWANQNTVHAELVAYRKAVNESAKECVLATAATEFTIADPNDAGQLDICGFDSSAPSVMMDFFRG